MLLLRRHGRQLGEAEAGEALDAEVVRGPEELLAVAFLVLNI